MNGGGLGMLATHNGSWHMTTATPEVPLQAKRTILAENGRAREMSMFGENVVSLRRAFIKENES